MEVSGPSKQLRLRRPDHCARCGRAFTPGDEALWYGEVKLVTCVQCPNDTREDTTISTGQREATRETDVDAGTAGASARGEHDRRRQKREDNARERLGSLGALVARLTDEPQSTNAWKRGAQGEEFAGKRLEKHLAGTGVKLIHDRRVPGHGKANLDHIAVGPGGITVIDTKNYRGKVRVQRVGGLFNERRTILTIAGRDRSRLVEAVEAQIEIVRTVLAGSEYKDVGIEGALCFADVDGLPLLSHQQLRGVAIDGPRQIAKLANRPGSLGEEAIAQIWRQIGRALPAA